MPTRSASRVPTCGDRPGAADRAFAARPIRSVSDDDRGRRGFIRGAGQPTSRSRGCPGLVRIPDDRPGSGRTPDKITPLGG
jgi:hypothetical protein